MQQSQGIDATKDLTYGNFVWFKQCKFFVCAGVYTKDDRCKYNTNKKQWI